LSRRNDGLADGLTVSSPGHVATAFACLRQRGAAPIRAEQQRDGRRVAAVRIAYCVAGTVAVATR
jgi:hypothetical protein